VSAPIPNPSNRDSPDELQLGRIFSLFWPSCKTRVRCEPGAFWWRHHESCYEVGIHLSFRAPSAVIPTLARAILLKDFDSSFGPEARAWVGRCGCRDTRLRRAAPCSAACYRIVTNSQKAFSAPLRPHYRGDVIASTFGKPFSVRHNDIQQLHLALSRQRYLTGKFGHLLRRHVVRSCRCHPSARG
jgi:hypothetical protein